MAGWRPSLPSQRPIVELVAELANLGVRLSLEEDQIRARGTLSAAKSEVAEAQRRKTEVIAYLRGGDQPSGTIVDKNRDRAFAGADPHDFGAMLDLTRFTDRSELFDRMVSAGQDHFWDPLDPRYLDFGQPFDVEREPLLAEEGFTCLRAPSVRMRLADPADLSRFINQVAWVRFSTLLHGEQGALNLSASLCNVLTDQGAQEFAANQAREEARHVTGFARYIKARWGRPAPCPPALKGFLTEIILSADVTKKIIGMQIMVEGLAMGSLGSLHKSLRDPVGKRLVQLVMTDEAFHHRFGKLWADRVVPAMSGEERARLESWTSHCLRDFVLKMSPPVELMVLRQFGLDPQAVTAELRSEAADGAALRDATGANEVFRVLTNILDKSQLLGVEARRTYAAFLESECDGVFDEEHEEIIRDGLEYLRAVNAAKA